MLPIFVRKAKRVLHSKDGNKIEQILNEMRELVDKKAFRDFVQKQSEMGAPEFTRADYLKSELTCYQCKVCTTNYVRFKFHHYAGGKWKEIEKAAAEFQTTEPIVLN